MDDRSARAELTFMLGMGFQLALAEFTRRLDEAGQSDLRPVHGMVFQALKRGGLTSTELAEALGVTKQASGQIVADLESRGYLARTDHPAGGRRRLVVLTAKAEEHLAVAGRVLHAFEAELADRLDDPDLAALRGRLAALIGALADGPVPPLRPVW